MTDKYTKPDRDCDLILLDGRYEYHLWLVDFTSINNATFVYTSSGFQADEKHLSMMKIENEDIHYRHNTFPTGKLWSKWNTDVDGEESYIDFLLAMQMCIREIENTLLGEV